jgi:hypothetical protein
MNKRFVLALVACALILAGGLAALAQSPAVLRPPGGLALDSGTKTATAVAGAATLNKFSGKVTSEVGITTAAGADYVLTLTNSMIVAADMVFASASQGTNTTEGLAINRITPAAGSVVIRVRNTHATVAFNGSVIVSFWVLKN